MSSARKSRDPPNPGNEPTEELGYPALVQYTFVPNDTESSEILVSEGDIVQLVYKVGGWVFVRTYNGKVGYIPFSFCKELECSKEVSLTYKETELKGQSKLINSIENRLVRTDFRQVRVSVDATASAQDRLKLQAKPSKRVHFADQPKNRNSCDICRNFLTSFTSSDHNFTSSAKKIKFKPHKLLKLLQTFSKEGFVNCGNTSSANNVQSIHGQISSNRINRRINSGSEFPIKFGNFCNQCDVLKDIFKNTNRYSMSDIYSTIRTLHLHAVTDSDSDQDDVSEESEIVGGSKQNGLHIIPTAENIPKRSISFKDQEAKQKVEIVRNNSFSGIAVSERDDFVVNRSSTENFEKQFETDKSNFVSNNARTEKANGVKNGSVDIGHNNAVLRNHKINNFFSESRQTLIGPPLTNGFEEDMTDFRSAEYHPPLVNKWRPANESRVQETLKQRPLGIEREQTFVYESMKARNKEVNFNDPRKENLNLTSGDIKKQKVQLNGQVRSFITDSRRKPLVSNGDFSLDDDKPLPESAPNGYKQGLITKCFTTYGNSAGLHSDVSTGKSLTLNKHFKHSSHYSNCENFDNTEHNHGHESVYQDHDNMNPKQTETDSAIDRRKIVARKVNPVTSPRHLMTASGPLMGRKNDKDIRKSLLEHTAIKKTLSSSPEMRTQPMRTQPMRAQHDIANHPNDASTASGRTVLVKKFNKQMWRPSIAGSEGSDQRPFSPFGGTLPPSKIIKKKVVEVFV